MILGILLGLSIAGALTSLLIIITSTSGILKENLITGAAIGTTQLASYAAITLALALAATLFLILTLKNKN